MRGYLNLSVMMGLKCMCSFGHYEVIMKSEVQKEYHSEYIYDYTLTLFEGVIN